MNRTLFFLSGWLLLSATAISQKGKSTQTKPNVIIILADDLGYGDVGFNGCKDIPTPNIDRIASSGVQFTQGYVSFAVCAPSRAGLLTGRYQDRFGFSRNPLYRPFDPEIGLPLTEQTLPEILQKEGYRRMGIGKWHLGAHQLHRPLKKGFDEFFGFLGGGHRYMPEDLTIEHQDSAKNEGESYRTKLVRNEQAVEETEYLTDAFSREAVSFIRRNQKQPFFLYLAYNAPHSPLQATEKYLSRFPGIANKKRKTYAAMVSAVDDGVGAVLQTLKEKGLLENTLVIFLSDNGGPENDNGSDNGPLRGQKGSLFEGGIRVPFVMQWPAKIPAKTVYGKPVSALDIFSTIAASIDNGLVTKNKLDGVNLLPFVNGKDSAAPHNHLFWRMYDARNYAVVSGDGMKSIVLRDSAASVFNLNTNISEQQEQAITDSKIAEGLNNALQNWLRQTVPPAFLGLQQEALYEQRKRESKNR